MDCRGILQLIKNCACAKLSIYSNVIVIAICGCCLQFTTVWTISCQLYEKNTLLAELNCYRLAFEFQLEYRTDGLFDCCIIATKCWHCFDLFMFIKKSQRVLFTLIQTETAILLC